MKTSLFRAEQEAKILSEKFPETTYFVLTKKGNACCHSVEWVVKEKLLNGYRIECKYKNGKII